MNLYELSNDLAMIDELEDTEQIKNIIIEEVKKKASNIIKLIRNKEVKINSIDEEIKRLQNLKRNEENKIKYIKHYTKECMDIMESKKIETELGNITLRKSPISLKVMSEENIPNEFKQIIQEIKIDKKAIIKHFNDTGEMFDGVQYITDNKNLMIK